MNLWGAADRQPVCTACPAGAWVSGLVLQALRWKRPGCERGRKA